jgi:hypothetical protein
MANKFYQNHIDESRRINNDFLAKYPSRQALVEYLFLSATIDSYRRVKTIIGIKDLTENDIRTKFVYDFFHDNEFIKDYLENKIITLTSENQAYTQSLTQRTDIEFHSNMHGLHFVIECKRLSSAETRYCQGAIKNGTYEIDGLEKFIHLIYAKGDDAAAMIAFVVNGKCDAIGGKLKEKIATFKPSTKMDVHLNQKVIDFDTSFQSHHQRVDETELLIYHLFFDFV